MIVHSKREGGSLVRLWWSASLDNSAYNPHNDNGMSRRRSNLPSAKQVLGTFQSCISLPLIIIIARPRESCLNRIFINSNVDNALNSSPSWSEITLKLRAVTARTVPAYVIWCTVSPDARFLDFLPYFPPPTPSLL